RGGGGAGTRRAERSPYDLSTPIGHALSTGIVGSRCVRCIGCSSPARPGSSAARSSRRCARRAMSCGAWCVGVRSAISGASGRSSASRETCCRRRRSRRAWPAATRWATSSASSAGTSRRTRRSVACTCRVPPTWSPRRRPAVKQTYEVGGPDRVTLGELVDLIGKALGRRRILKFNVPRVVVRVATRALHRLPYFPLTPDQLLMLEEDNVCDPAPFFSTFGLAPLPLATGLRQLLG